MQAGWIVGVARKTGGRIDAEEYGVAIGDMTMALNAVRRLVGRGPDSHAWVKGPLLADAEQLEPGSICRRDSGVQATPGPSPFRRSGHA
jgi:hypothetical protein